VKRPQQFALTIDRMIVGSRRTADRDGNGGKAASRSHLPSILAGLKIRERNRGAHRLVDGPGLAARSRDRWPDPWRRRVFVHSSRWARRSPSRAGGDTWLPLIRPAHRQADIRHAGELAPRAALRPLPQLRHPAGDIKPHRIREPIDGRRQYRARCRPRPTNR